MTGGAGPSGERGARAGLLALLAGPSMEERRGAGRLLGWAGCWFGLGFSFTAHSSSFPFQTNSNLIEFK